MVLEDSRLGIAHAHDDALRKITELFAEQVEPPTCAASACTPMRSAR